MKVTKSPKLYHSAVSLLYNHLYLPHHFALTSTIVLIVTMKKKKTKTTTAVCYWSMRQIIRDSYRYSQLQIVRFVLMRTQTLSTNTKSWICSNLPLIPFKHLVYHWYKIGTVKV